MRQAITDLNYVSTRTFVLQAAGLWALAVALPLLALVGASPEFLVAHRATRVDILLLVLLLMSAGPAVALAFITVAGLFGPRVRHVAIDLTIASVAGVMAAQLVVHAGVGRWYLALPIVVGGAVLAVAGYRRWPGVRSFVTVSSIAVVAAPALLVSKPGIRTLLAGTPAVAAVATTENVAARSRTPVVVVVFDELPLLSLLDANRGIDSQLYPNIAGLAADGVWFRNATTVDDFTRYALPALVSGRYPDRKALPTASDYPDTVFTLVAGTHRLEVAEAVTALCPPSLCAAGSSSIASRIAAMGRDLRVVFLHLVLPEDLAGDLPDLSATWANFGDDTPGVSDDDGASDSDGREVEESVRARWRHGIDAARVTPVRQFIDGISADDPQPTFYFLHALVSHQPHRMLPSGKENLTWHRLPGRRGWNRPHPWTVGQHYQHHLLQVGFVDRLVGELVARLKSTGLYERTLLVLTSDHGISYLPNAPQRDLTGATAAEIMRVPLVIKFPDGVGPKGITRDDNVESIDLLPTIASVIGVEPRARVDGSSVLDATRPLRRSKAMFSGDDRRRRRYSASGPDLAPALARKAAVVGDTARTAHAAPRVEGYDALVGLRLDALRVVDGADAVEIADRDAFARVDPDASAVPFDVAGRFATPRPDAVVAVGVNGVVEAVARTWEANPRGFMATPRLAAWRRGANAVEVFVVEKAASGLVLRRTSRQAVRPADLNLISAEAAEVWGVAQAGLYQVERAADGTTFRWTRDRAVFSNLSVGVRPQAVEVTVLHVPDRGRKRLRIDLSGCVLFEGDVESGWTKALPLGACTVGENGLTLGLAVAAARSGRDARRRGVALSRVVVR